MDLDLDLVPPRSAPERAPSTPSRLEAPSPDRAAAREYAGYGIPGPGPFGPARYAIRVYDRRARLRERRVFRARATVDAESAYEGACVALGRAIHDAGPSFVEPSLARLREHVDTALAEVSALAKARGGAEARAARERELAAARRELAEAGVAPFEQEERQVRVAMAEAEHALEDARETLAELESAYRNAVVAGRTDAEHLRSMDQAIDAARTRVATHVRAHRDATLRFAEMRRRVVRQVGRLAEVEKAAAAMVVKGRRDLGEHRKREAAAADRLRGAFAALGRSAHERGLGSSLRGDVLAQARIENDAYEALVREVALVHEALGCVDALAYRKGAATILAGVGLLIAALGAIAVFAP